jgi:hypothetical protein
MDGMSEQLHFAFHVALLSSYRGANAEQT